MCNCATSSFSSTPQAQCPVSSYSVGQPRMWLSATLGFPFALESSDLIIPFPSLSRHRYHANCHPRPAPRSSKDKNRFHPCSQWGGGVCQRGGWEGRHWEALYSPSKGLNLVALFVATSHLSQGPQMLPAWQNAAL